MKKLNNKGMVSGVVMGLILVGLIAVGETGRQAGKMGNDGEWSVHNCYDTHVDGNCAHMKIKDL